MDDPSAQSQGLGRETLRPLFDSLRVGSIRIVAVSTVLVGFHLKDILRRIYALFVAKLFRL